LDDSHIGCDDDEDFEFAATVLRDENNNSKEEAEGDHDGSDDGDDDEGTRAYWRVKAKEGHKVGVI
jgi:hypothetical protein